MKYTKKTLDNGLQGIYIPMENTKTMTVLVLVGTGSRHETEDINGISHFLEHMMFKGTEKRPDKRKIAEELDAVGAEFNAYTGTERTAYYVKTDTKHAGLAIDVVSDIFLNSTIPAEEIEKERGVIIGEIDMNEDNPMRKIWYVLFELLYPNHPLGRDIKGTKGTVKKLSREDFLSYREKHYKASNSIVVISGDVTANEAHNFATKYFTGAVEGDAPAPKPANEKQKGPSVLVQKRKTDQTHLALALRAFSHNDPRRWALSVLSTILGGNMSSRLFMHVRDELGLGYYIRSGIDLATDHGSLAISAGVETARLTEAVRAIMKELRIIKEKSITSAELKRAQDYIIGSTLINLEASDELAGFYGEQAVLRENILTPEEKFRMIEGVTADDVQQVARDIFTNERLNLALIGPVDDDSELKEELTFSN